MESIWTNSFYNTAPALSWVYKADFSQLINANAYSETPWIEYLKILGQATVEISIGKRETNAADVYYGGLQFKKITRAVNTGTLTFKFNENEDYLVTYILEKLFDAYALTDEYILHDTKTVITNNTTDIGLQTTEEQDIPYRSEFMVNDPLLGTVPYLGNIIVTMDKASNLGRVKDLNGNVANRSFGYKFLNCKLQDIQDIQMSYESKDNITRTATFLYDGMIKIVGNE